MANTYTLISSNVLSSNASSVTFSSIPATYTDLVIRFTARSTSADTDPTNTARLRIDLNGDSSTGSITTVLAIGTSTASTTRDSSTNYVLGLPGTNTASNIFSNGEIYIPSYTVSQNKPFSIFAVTENNAAAVIISSAANLWRTTSAVTSVTFQALFGSMVTGSSFYVYGISNA
jgi:hypothetical protein